MPKTRLNSNRIRRMTAVMIAVSMLICLLPTIAYSANRGEIVRVGACPDFGISKTGSVYSGFAYDYLTEIQEFTGHRYVYVEGTPEELIEMLADGTIDVIPCITAGEYEQLCNKYFEEKAGSPDTNAMPILSSSSLMKKFTAVYVNATLEDRITYCDINSLNKATIGYLEENTYKYFSDDRYIRGDIDNAQFVPYSTEAQLRTDFLSGKVDAVIKECFRVWGDENTVYQYDTNDCYFMVSGEDASLARQLDVAVNSIMMQKSGFANAIYKKHIEKFGAQKYAFSYSEISYIESNPKLVVAYNVQAGIMESFNNAKGNIVGMTGDVLDEIEKQTGLGIEIKACSSLEEAMRLLSEGKADIACGGVTRQSVARYGSFKISSPYSISPAVFVGKTGTQLNSGIKIAVPSYRDDISEFIRQNYINASLLMYNTAEKCMQAVNEAQADVACLCAYDTIYLINSAYKDFSVLSVTPISYNECFAFREDADSNLTSLIGKALINIHAYSATKSSYNSLTHSSELSLINAVPIQVMYIVLIALAVVVAIGIAILFAMRLKVKRDSEIDTLTGGRNKFKFIEDVKKLMKKTSPEKWAMVLFDIDKFKYVNDRLGYQEGDRMLERIYKTLSDNMEENELFARVSDDNFACIIKNGSDTEISTRMTNIYAEFERRNSLFVKYPVVFSAGVCRMGQCRDGGKDIDVNTALDRCIIAKRTMKNTHFSSVAFYDGKIRDKALREKDYENIMPIALENHEFECYLQPKYGLKSRHIEGAEALIRWNSKDFGFVFPNEFIPISEKNGFVVELDFFILEEVCRAMRRWLNSGKTPVVISVNQSRLHLNYDDYIWRLREIVDKYEIPYEYIELELTESVFMENADKLLEIMQKLHDIGFKLSLDDFGSGYSSLNMLKDIPVDVVKIDREFFNGTVNSEKGRAVISTVIDLANNLDMDVISEGVETVEQVEFLSQINCSMVQGYYFAKPMTIPQFEKLWEKDLESNTTQNN